MKTTYSLKINESLSALVCLEGVGQNEISEDDLVKVKVVLGLPVLSDELVPEIRFKTRLLIGGESLYGGWGNRNNNYPNYRVIYKTFCAITWKQARAKGAAWAKGEVEKIKEALRTRAKALEDAGIWEE